MVDVAGMDKGLIGGAVTSGCRRPARLASGESELQCSAARFGAEEGDRKDLGRHG